MNAASADLHVHEAPAERIPSETEKTVRSYLRRLHFQDSALIDKLAADCVERAQRRVAKNDSGELLRRALEEAQRRFDQAVARALGPNSGRDPGLVASVRAALLLGRSGISVDELFLSPAVNPEIASLLQARRPVALPPEAPVAMPPQKLRFVFFKSV